MNRLRNSLPVFALTALIIGCPAAAPNGGGNAADTAGAQTFTATFDAAQETDDVTSAAFGSGTFELRNDNTELFLNVTATGLSGPVEAAHFHNAPAGEDGGIIFDLGLLIFEMNGEVTILGTVPLADFSDAEALSLLQGGNVYVNLHTEAFGAGEIRGQLLPD